MTKISAEVVADSICNGHRITTMKVVMPRIVLAEAKTHRVMKRTDEGLEVYDIPGIGFNDDEMLSRNSASSRAIPFRKMLEAVQNDPFIPIAWQKDHSGMQGTQYFTEPHEIQQLKEMHLRMRDQAAREASRLHEAGVTKQQCNRYLEPFMWHTVLVTATEYENFFHLRCPQYVYQDGTVFRSRKDFIKHYQSDFQGADIPSEPFATELQWLQCNKGQAEIHMMALAEAMWDARNESEPRELQPGQWHIPYGENFDLHTPNGIQHNIGSTTLKMWLDAGGWNEKLAPYEVQLSTGVCAKTSYTVIGDDKSEVSPTNLLDLHNSLLVRPYTNRKGVVFGPDDPIHTSPAEHCAQAMTEEEFCGFVKGSTPTFIDSDGTIGIHERYVKGKLGMPKTQDHPFGWCHNLRGWKSYRSMIPNENRR